MTIREKRGRRQLAKVRMPLVQTGYRQLCSASLTNRSSQPLAVVKSTFDFMKQFIVFATLALASGGSAPSR
jgi:hypothetical protein